MIIEKPQLEIRFMPLVCSAPLVYAHKSGIFAAKGLEVNLARVPGWSGIKELMVHGKVDAAHMLAPMPLACNLGIDGRKADIVLAAIQNRNGQALTLSTRHLGLTRVEDLKGLTFGVPYLFSMHYYLLCHYLASHGVNPLKEVTIEEVAPPRMPYYLEKGWVDGVFAPEPFNQIIVNRGLGFIRTLSKDIWEGHPCCSFAVGRSFMENHPNTYRALLEGVLEAQLVLIRAGVEELSTIAEQISDEEHLNQPDSTAVAQVLTGEFPDGTGAVRSESDRVEFVPHAHEEYGLWMLTQMQRWGQLAGKVDYRQVVESTFRTSETADMARTLGFPPQEGPSLGSIAPFTGKKPSSYLAALPFNAHKKRKARLKDYHLPEEAVARLGQVAAAMAEVAGGRRRITVDVTGSGELGLLERAFNDMILNMRFDAEALAEEKERLETAMGQLRAEAEARREAEGEVQRLNRSLQEKVEVQAAAILELSTPVIRLSENAVLVPLIGVVDTIRAQKLMETLLDSLAASHVRAAIIDVTGILTIDTSVARYLMQTVSAAGMLGVRVLISGLNPDLAQTLVRIGVDLSGMETVGSLRRAVTLVLSEGF